MRTTLLCSLISCLLTGLLNAQVNETEPNNTSAQANFIAYGQIMSGACTSTSVPNCAASADNDYFFINQPYDGTLKITVSNTCVNSGANLRCRLVFQGDIIEADPQSTTTKTYTYPCSGAGIHTFFLQGFECCAYTISYEVTGSSQSLTDTGSNDTKANAIFTRQTDTITGSVKYISNSVDYSDWYKILMPISGSLRIMLDVTNTGSGNGHLEFRAEKKSGANIMTHYTVDLSAGVTIKDTVYLNCLTTDSIFFWVYGNNAGTCFKYKFFSEILSFRDTTLYVVCSEEKKDLTTLYDTAGYSVNWNTAIPQSVGIGTYNVVFSNSNGCIDTAKVVIKQKIATWTGSSNSNWHTPSNWDIGTVPDINTHVIIPTTAPACIVSGGDAFAASVQSRSSSAITVVTGRTLTITSNCNPLPN